MSNFKKNVLFLIIFLLISSCVFSTNFDEKNNYNFKKIYFEVVEKKINFTNALPNDLKKMIESWFSNSVKVNGYNGILEVFINEYNEELVDIPDGKKILLSLNFEIIIKNETLSQKETLQVNISEFSEIEGDFSINELEVLKYNTQLNMVSKMSNLKDKF